MPKLKQISKSCKSPKVKANLRSQTSRKYSQFQQQDSLTLSALLTQEFELVDSPSALMWKQEFGLTDSYFELTLISRHFFCK